MKFLAIFLLAAVLLFNFAQAAPAPEEEHDHPHDVGVGDCPCLLTLEYKPLCASNGYTYSSEGSLRCAKECLKKADLVKVKDGHC